MAEYTEDKIKHLEDLEHVRTRPGMYIGRLGNGSGQDDGIYVMLKEVVDNSIDEFGQGAGKQILIDIDDTGHVSVRDYGRGIPLGKVVEVVSKLNTGGKFDDEVFQQSVGLNGVGTKVVNALSQDFCVRSHRDGQCVTATFCRGELVETHQEATSEKNGTLVRFFPDREMFGEFSFNMDYVETMVKNYSYLHKGLSLVLNGTAYKSENGLLDLVTDNLSEDPLYPPIHLEGKDIEIVLTHGGAYGENISSFVNGQNTRDGGTHLAAFREAVAKTLKEFYGKNYQPEDVRQGIIAAVAVKVQAPRFESQTKIKLGSTYLWEKKGADGKMETGPSIRSFVNDFVAKALDDYLRIHKDIVPVIEEKIKDSQKEREEISGIQKKARERNKKTSVYNRKLRDCRYHLGDKSTEKTQQYIESSSIFITEGDSASGTITEARDANYQAVFSLRGKPINCYKESRKKVADNEEFNLLVSALGVEEDVSDLRYNQIIVATDADDDGMHIRMLVLTFFMKYYPDLIRRGHVHILQTPLFRVRNKKDNRYCYDQAERDRAIAELKTGVEITRFKGLGEISPKEFSDFIGDGMRLDLVKLADEESIAGIMEFYMGDNTLERQNFIRANLRSEEQLEDVDV